MPNDMKLYWSWCYSRTTAAFWKCPLGLIGIFVLDVFHTANYWTNFFDFEVELHSFSNDPIKPWWS